MPVVIRWATFFAFILGTASLSAIPEELRKRIPIENQRYSSFEMALDLIKERQLKTMVETGTARCGKTNCLGDGCSTLIFSHCASKIGGTLYSVDIDPHAVDLARTATAPYADHLVFVCGDSCSFLAEFKQPIDFLYLDSYDYELDNPKPSQEHHLKEIIAAYPHLTKKSVVMIDDCMLPGGGKGALAIPFLLQRGWKVVFLDYQTILVQE